MTREEALDNLKAPSAHVRGQAARALGDVGRRTDLPRLQKAQREETVTYVNYALQETIRRLTHEQAPAPSTDEADVVSEDVRKQIYGKAMEWITGFLLHEISSPIGLVRLAAKRELGERWEGSGTQKHLESVARVFDAIEVLKNAASVPRPQEFDLPALVDELLDGYEPEVREWISTIGARPFLIKSDPSLVRMVVVNGIRNAVEAQKAASEDQNAHAVTISWGDSDVDYWLAVLDHGAGLTGPIETAFEVGNSTKKNHIGFGLAIARQAVETMIGSLTLEPAKQGGALLHRAVAQMTAYILVVEDDESFIEELRQIIADSSGPTIPTFVTNREDAEAKLESGFFDFAILDLKIPTAAGTTDFDPEHGKYVFHHVRKVSPGTKILVLTSSPSDDFIAPLLAQKHDADIWSEGAKVDTVEFLKKIELDQAPDKISRVVSAIHALSEIELHTNGLNLSTGEDRLVRIFSKHFKAATCSVHPIGAGKSGARPLRLQMYDQTGALIREVVAKLGDLAKMQDEDARYDEHVMLLDPAATPRKMKLLEFGAGSMAGLFYQLANGHDASMFNAMAQEDALAAKAVAATAEALAGWSNGKNQERRSIASIRVQWVSDEKAAELQAQYGLDWAAEFESRLIQTRWCCVHGDLHGENILVSAEGGVLVIDYGDVGFGAAAYDPMTLELSAVLQANPTLAPEWPTADACRQWHDLDAYLVGCPMPEFIRACRAWSEKLMVGRRELSACAYSYLLRQLKYPDTDKDRIMALLEGVHGCWGDS